MAVVLWKGRAPHWLGRDAKLPAAKRETDGSYTPSVTLVDDRVWKKYAKLPTVQALLDNGQLDGVSGDVEDLAGCGPELCEALISQERDLDKLEAWLDAERRSSVKTLLNKRLDALAKLAPKRGGKKQPPKSEKPSPATPKP